MAAAANKADPTRQFYTKFNRAKEQLAKGNLQACLANLVEAISVRLSGQFMRRELKMITTELFAFMTRVADHKLYKEV